MEDFSPAAQRRRNIFQSVTLTRNWPGWWYFIESAWGDLLRKLTPSGGDWLGFSIFPRRSRWQGPDHKLPRRAQFFLGHFNILSLLKDSFMFSSLNYLTDVNSCWEYLPKFLSCWPCNDFLWLLDLFLNRTGNWTWQAWKMRWEMLSHLQRNVSVMRVKKKKIL